VGTRLAYSEVSAIDERFKSNQKATNGPYQPNCS